MKTPICDFVQKYQQSGAERLHMPGHKGQSHLGYEPFDLTEIDGADSLFSAKGIIAQSEQNASALFGAHTFYSTEGSSLAIKAMLLLVAKYAKAKGQTPLVLAGRNAHKAFVSGVALVDVDVEWIFAKDQNYLSCNVTAEEIANLLDTMDQKPTAVYLTSPDYLGNVVDVASIAKVCKARDVLLVVDNAHGAYLKFTSDKMHPIDLGADMCCDSAHKTLPCLTGGAYLHISKLAPAEFCEQAKNALALFGSTSPSYLILQSLDKLNNYLADGYPQKLNTCMQKVQLLKQNLRDYGWTLVGNEPLKITLQTKPFGHTGDDLASMLCNQGIVCEFHDADFVVFMLTPDNNLDRLQTALMAVEKRQPICESQPQAVRPSRALTIRQATLAPSEFVDVECTEGKVLADLSVGCPPAVPILVCGEVVDKNAIDRFRYYGVNHIAVVK